MPLVEVISILILGFIAGVIGGLGGIGGSVIMLPGLHLVVGDDPESIHHRYMAAAMCVNFAVAIPATLRHRRADAIDLSALRLALPASLVSIVAGTIASNFVPARALKFALAAFLLLYGAYSVARAIARKPETDAPRREDKSDKTRFLIAGAAGGLIGGLLGLGGGLVLVPMLQLLCGVRLRRAIATSSAIICVTSLFGASLKLATLSRHGESSSNAVTLALLLAPTAIIGGRIGASLTHRLPLQAVRIAIAAILLASAWSLVR